MEGVERYKVRLLKHNPAWKDEFCRVHELLREVWGENAIAIEHVGSTAIPAIPAKPVLDVAVTVKSLEGIDAEALICRGYEDCGWQNAEKTRRLFVLRGEIRFPFTTSMFIRRAIPIFTGRSASGII